MNIQNLPNLTIEQIDAALARMNWHEYRQRARTDLFFLLTDVLGRKDIDRPWLKARCEEVQKNPDGYLDLWAREHYKSTIITFGKSIQRILESHGDDALDAQECTIGIFSHTRPSAKGFLRQIKMEFENNQRLKDLFPDILYTDPKKEAQKWSEDDGIIVKRRTNPKEATVEAWGVVDGQPIGKHFTDLNYDDVVTAESVTTPDMIRTTTDRLVLSYNLGANGGKRRFIGTRYHLNDSYSEVIKRGTAIPRVYAATKDGQVAGEPVLLRAEQLAQKRRDMGSYVFACQMLQNPLADSVQSFKPEDIKFYDNPDSVRGNTYIMMDPAGEKKKHNDYTAGWVVTLGEDGNIYIRDGVRDRLNLKERTAILFHWHRTYKPYEDTGVRYEKYGKDSDIEHIESEQEKQTYRFEVTAVGGPMPKADRIKRLIPYSQARKLYFPRSLVKRDYQNQQYDLIQVFINEEYNVFPVPIHDDMLDALARLIDPKYPLVWPKPTPVAHQNLVAEATQLNYGYENQSDGGWMG